MHLTVSTVVWAIVWSALAAAAVWAVTTPLRRRSVSGLLASLVLTGAGASTGAMAAATREMLLDSGWWALVAVIAISGVMAGLAAVAAGRRLAAGRNRERLIAASRHDLVAWAGLDLRAPLEGLRAVNEAHPDPLVTAYLERLDRGVDDLLELSRIQTGRLGRPAVEIDLTEMVDRAVAALTPLAESSSVELHRDQDAARSRVHGDRLDLDRAVVDLVSDAVRNTPAGGTIRVRADERDGQALIVVDGDYQARDEAVGGARGVARDVATAHGGSVVIDRGRHGCSITLQLPMPS